MRTHRLPRAAATIPALALAILSICLPSAADAFPPTSGNWTPGSYFGLIGEARDFAAAASLPDGGMLLAGGKVNSGLPTSEALAYDPYTGFWRRVAPMSVQRDFAVAASLPDGEVMVAGGHNLGGYLNTAEAYYEGTNSWRSLPSMLEAREGAAAVSLPNGDVLVAGGEGSSHEYLATAELYDPATNKWTAVAPMLEARERAAAALLPNGDVLMAGGEDENSKGEEVKLATSEIYDPTTNTWTPAAEMSIGREAPVAAKLPNGEVLVAGGESEEDGILATSEIYDPATNTWTPAAEMLEVREGASAVTLPNGEVMLAGGFDGSAMATTEFFYSAPQARTAGGEFGAQTVGEPSQGSVLTVTNVGAQTLSIAGASLGGATPGDFAITADACAGVRLAYRQSCAITVRFTPAAAGKVEASVVLADNAASTAIALSGTGVALGAGPQGPAGPQGAKGAKGASGKVELITCERTKRHKGSSVTQTCKTKLGDSPIKFTTDGLKIAAVLSRGHVTYAKGFELGPDGKLRLVVSPLRKLGKGRYTLTLKRGNKLLHETVTIG